MKKILTAAAAFLLAGLAFAAPGPDNGPGQGPEAGPQGAPGLPPGVEWKVGTSILIEYKKLMGQIQIGQKLVTTFKAEGIEYILALPKREGAALVDLKNGDTVSFEGVTETIKTADGKTTYTFRPFKALVNGKEIELRKPGSHEPEMMRDRPMEGNR